MPSNLTPLFVAAALAASIGAAGAYPATVSAAMPMHALPSSGSPVVAVIPASAPIDANSCRSWCRVSYGGLVGYVQAPFVVAGTPAPGHYGSSLPY
ncbi:hypothetical protein [Methylocystis echinoides]|jgi:uncharacterized protein YraI|uniref:hypothetical protein n=1 Tax=Methylocystis echinoides TaxID=29468 RepID=UPI0034147EA4